VVKSQYMLYLKSLPIFQGLDNQVLKKIVAASTLIEVQTPEQMEEILTEDELVIVLAGELELYYENAKHPSFKIRSVNKGESFSLLESDTDRLLIKPAKETVLMKVPLMFIEHLLIQNVKFKQNVIMMMNEKLRSSYDRLITLIGRDSHNV
jgi:CRP-like cAMP-binding protein